MSIDIRKPPMSQERRPNRLIDEVSPYLTQHAHNPVDWYPWGEEALDEAKREDKPILLSIGYSACHWCHVMERESFDNEDIAKQMNADFVCIKVDREERPDLDHIYQLVVQMMGRSGGWPLTVFLTPDQHPFFGGTYFPPHDKLGMPGFPRVLEAVAEAYRERRSQVEAQAEELAEGITRAVRLETRQGAKTPPLGPNLLDDAAKRLGTRFDDRHGGFGTKPKFPSTMSLEVLLRHGMRADDSDDKGRVALALEAMRKGGIWDQLGGGFHRYSTDERWLVPHFEKMLYDNALLLRLYTEGYRAFGETSFADTAKETGSWLLSEMQSPEGGFYSALDADTEGEEGKFYVFTKAQVEDALAGDALAIDVANMHFGVTDVGNFEETGATVLHVSKPLDVVAKMLERPLDEVKAALDRARKGLLAARAKRSAPFRDEKVLASWNGLTIAALADASLALEEPSLLDAAKRAFAHIERSLLDGGRVSRLTKDSVTKGTGFLDDHAFVGWAALELYEATADIRYLERARDIADEILARFWDDAHGGFFFTPHDGEALIVRAKDPYDQSIPSGASIAAHVLLKLGAMIDEKYTAPAERHLELIARDAILNPFAFSQTVLVLDSLVRGSTDIVIVGKRDDLRTDALVDIVFRSYLPSRNLVRVDPDEPASASLPKLLAEGKAGMEAPVAYVCRGRTCSLPIGDSAALEAELNKR